MYKNNPLAETNCQNVLRALGLAYKLLLRLFLLLLLLLLLLIVLCCQFSQILRLPVVIH